MLHRVGRARPGSTSTDYELARRIGIVALALILFEGGLTAGFSEIRPVLRPARLARGGRHARDGRDHRLAAVWLFDLTPSRGCCSGSIVAATDGAAIFALLRGSTLRRRLARTLEGEAGFNDPVAVLLVIGFIDWIEKPDYGIGRHGDPVRRGDRDRRGVVGVAVGWLAVEGSSAPGSTHRALSGRLAGDGRGRLRGGRRAARIRLPRGVRGRAGARLGAHPGQAHRRPCSTRAWPGSRRSRCSSRSGCSCSRASSTTWRSRAPRSRWCWCSWRARWRSS